MYAVKCQNVSYRTNHMAQKLLLTVFSVCVGQKNVEKLCSNRKPNE